MQQHLFIAGANGGIGRQVVEQALSDGYRVTALVRNPAKLQLSHPDLEIVQGNVLDPASFAHHLQNKDAVLSALGESGGLFSDRPTILYSRGSANLLAAMQQYGVKRVCFISASALDVSPVLPWYARFAARYILQKLLKHMYADLRRMEATVKASGADWTIVRPPQLTDGPLTGLYRTAVTHSLKTP